MKEQTNTIHQSVVETLDVGPEAPMMSLHCSMVTINLFFLACDRRVRAMWFVARMLGAHTLEHSAWQRAEFWNN